MDGTRRSLLQGGLALASSTALAPVACAWPSGTSKYNSASPADNVIPVSTLTTGTYPANNWTGFTTPTSELYSGPYFNATPDDQIVATSTTNWRDMEVSTWTLRGCIYLRLAGGSALVFYNNGQANSGAGLVEIGIVQNFVPNTSGGDFGGSGNFYFKYINENPVATLPGYSTTYTAGNTFTFGCSGFNVYLKINGTTVVSFTEWRLCQAGVAALWGHAGLGFKYDIRVHYLTPLSLFSTPSTNTYDPRDFGMRNVAAVTGNMAASSNQLALNGPHNFIVGDQIIVEIGGEAGAGNRGTIGVGGTWPALNYVSVAAMNADTSQATGTCCYVVPASGTKGNVFQNYSWSGAVSFTGTQSGTNLTTSAVTGTIRVNTLIAGTGITAGTYIVSQTSGTSGGAGVYVTSQSGTASSASCTAGWNQGLYQFPTLQYYPYIAVPLSLVATISAISGNTLTLSGTASIATTNANVWLDCLPSFIVINESLPPIVDGSGFGNFAPIPNNISISIPTSGPSAAWQLSNIVSEGVEGQAVTSGLQIYGQASSGSSITTLRNPMGCTCGAINLDFLAVNNISIQHLNYIGNQGPNGFMFQVNGPNIPSGGVFPTVFSLTSPGAVNTGLLINDINGLNALGPFLQCSGSGPIISNGFLQLNDYQRDYVQWEFSLNVSQGNWTGSTTLGTNGIIQNCTGTCPYNWNAFEVFGCNGCSILNCAAVNGGYSTNSSTSTLISLGLSSGLGNNIVFTSGCYNPVTGLDDAIIDVNDNAFSAGTTGLILCQPGFTATQQGYIDGLGNTYKWIQMQPLCTGWTVQGGFPGTGGCSTTLGGLFQAPNYQAGSNEYGNMAVLSGAASTIVNGIRVKGSAIPSPGIGGNWGNICLLGASSEIENCVADSLGPAGPTLSNNQTNTAYGGC